MNNQMNVRQVLFNTKAEMQQQEEDRPYHHFMVIDGKIVVEIQCCKRNSNLRMTNGIYTGANGKSTIHKTVKELAVFIIDKVQKIVTDTLNGSSVSYRLYCEHRKSVFGEKHEFTIDIPEENLISRNITGIIGEQVGDAFVPFPLATSKSEINSLLSTYIIEFYNSDNNKADDNIIYDHNEYGLYIYSEGKYQFRERVKFECKQTDAHIYVKDFYNLLQCDMKTVLLLYFFFFSAVFKKFLQEFYSEENMEIKMHCCNILLARNFGGNIDKAYLMALVNPYLDTNSITNLSELKQTKLRDSVKESLFESNHSTIVVNDDAETSNYAGTNNLRKIRELSEYVVERKPISTGKDFKRLAECNCVIISERCLNEFTNEVYRDFIEFNADNLKALKAKYKAEEIRAITLKFNKVLSWHITDVMSNPKNREILVNKTNDKIKFTFLHNLIFTSHETELTLDTLFLFVQLLEDVFLKYADRYIFQSCKNIFNELCSKQFDFEKLAESSAVSDKFTEQVNDYVNNNPVLRIEDYSVKNKSSVFYHETAGALLFSPVTFYNLFWNKYLMSQVDFRRNLYEHDILISNMGEKLMYRMPSGDRKTCIAISIDCLKPESLKKLPCESVETTEWNFVNKDYNIWIGNDKKNNPIYWPVDKEITNKFAVVLGNSGYGKTYWTTSVLIKGLHDSGHNVIIIENNLIHSYSKEELGKALPKEYITANFCFYSEWSKTVNLREYSTAESILECFKANKNKVVIIDSYKNEELNDFLTLLIKYQQSCKESDMKFEDVFMVLDEAAAEDIQKNKVLTTIYNQGRKLGISMITILQYFAGCNSENFRKKIFQAALKVTFNLNDATVGKFLKEFPNCDKIQLKKDIANLNRGEAVICGEFEDKSGKIKKGIFYKNA